MEQEDRYYDAIEQVDLPLNVQDLAYLLVLPAKLPTTKHAPELKRASGELCGKSLSFYNHANFNSQALIREHCLSHEMLQTNDIVRLP